MDEALRRCRPLLGTFVEVAATGVDLLAIDAAFVAVARVHAASAEAAQAAVRMVHGAMTITPLENAALRISPTALLLDTIGTPASGSPSPA